MIKQCVIFTMTVICTRVADARMSQQSFPDYGNYNLFTDINAANEPPDNQDDPVYKIYKEGYDLILDEQWDGARKKLSQVISKYPKSEYLDDAMYWTAFALKNTDRKKAIEAYRGFIDSFTTSRYYDDAVADLEELKTTEPKTRNKSTARNEAEIYETKTGLVLREGEQAMHIGEDGIVIGEGPDSIITGKTSISIGADGKSYRFGYVHVPRAKSLERALRFYARALAHPRFPKIDAISPIQLTYEKIDSQTRLKLDALYALGDSKEDENSLQALKEVVLDLKQPDHLREAALYLLADFNKYDLLPVFKEIAKKDTNENMQIYAIDYISQHDKDKNKAVNALIDLFYSYQPNRSRQRQMIFYSIADIGNNQAVDFLGKIARTSDDFSMRQEAVYYLGSIGGDKARNILYQILKEK